MCNMDGTRLAVYKTQEEGQALRSFLLGEEPWISTTTAKIQFYTGMRAREDGITVSTE